MDLWVAGHEVTGFDVRCASRIFADRRGADFHGPTSVSADSWLTLTVGAGPRGYL
jgi:hypothetical protein